MLNRSNRYSGIVVGLTYGAAHGVNPSNRMLAHVLDDAAAIDCYAEDCPATERCPVSPHGPVKAIVVVEA